MRIIFDIERTNGLLKKYEIFKNKKIGKNSPFFHHSGKNLHVRSLFASQLFLMCESHRQNQHQYDVVEQVLIPMYQILV